MMGNNVTYLHGEQYFSNDNFIHHDNMEDLFHDRTIVECMIHMADQAEDKFLSELNAICNIP